MKLFNICIAFLIFSCNEISYKREEQLTTGVNKQFENKIEKLMKSYNIPGGVIGICKKEDSHIYSFGTIDKQTITKPFSKFRIASISKPITALGVLLLIDKKMLDFDDSVVDILKQGGFKTERIIDSKWELITIKDLLYHSGGWQHFDHNDPMLNTRYDKTQINSRVSVVFSSDIINEMFGEPLDFTPGEQYSYSNFGYHILGRIIEIISGVSYREFITKEILIPLRMTNTFLGKTKLGNRLENETIYFDYPEAPEVESVFLHENFTVPRPYGGFSVELLDSSGGWVSTAEDLLKFANGYNKLLSSTCNEIMLSSPDYTTNDTFYAMGWNVAKESSKKVIWHTGSLPGTLATLVKLDRDISFVALFNSRDRDLTFLNEINEAILEYMRNEMN